MQMYSESDVDTANLIDQQVTILGYGSQGRAHALNLKDSGFNVVVGLRPDGPSWAKAEADGLTVKDPVAAVKDAALVAFLTPDMVQKSLYATIIDHVADGAALLFAHGFAMHFKQIEARSDLDVVLIAPKGPGGLVRRQYEEGHGVPCLVAVHAEQDRQCAAARPCLCGWHRWRTRRRHRNDLCRRNRNGPFRRAGRACVVARPN